MKKNFGIAFIGSAVYQACQWGMLVLLAKMASAEEVGLFALALAISSPIVIFAALNLGPIQVTDINEKYTLGDFVSLRIVTVVLATIVILCVAGFSGYPRETALIIVFVGLNHCMTITREVFQSYMQKNERMDYVAISQVISGLLSLAALGLTVSMTGSLLYGVIAMLFARLLAFVTWDNHAVRKIYASIRSPESGPLIRLSMSPRLLTALAWLALPAALMAVMTRFVSVLPQYFVEGMLGTEALGFYAALAAIPLFGQMAVRAAGASALPRLSRMFAERRPGFFKLSAKLAGVGLGVGVVAILVAVLGGKPLITLIFTPEYADYHKVFVWLMVYGATAYFAACIGYALYATRWFWAQPIMFVLVLIAVASLCWLWVPQYGLTGAVMAMIVGRLVQIPVAIGIIIWAGASRPAAPLPIEH